MGHRGFSCGRGPWRWQPNGPNGKAIGVEGLAAASEPGTGGPGLYSEDGGHPVRALNRDPTPRGGGGVPGSPVHGFSAQGAVNPRADGRHSSAGVCLRNPFTPFAPCLPPGGGAFQGPAKTKLTKGTGWLPGSWGVRTHPPGGSLSLKKGPGPEVGRRRHGTERSGKGSAGRGEEGGVGAEDCAEDVGGQVAGVTCGPCGPWSSRRGSSYRLPGARGSSTRKPRPTGPFQNPPFV